MIFPRRSGNGSRAKPLAGCRGEALAGVWGGTPSPTPQRFPSKRANSPQGYEASGTGIKFPRRSGTGSRAKPLAGGRGEALAGVWGGIPSPTPQRFPSKRANSPRGYEASGTARNTILVTAANPPIPRPPKTCIPPQFTLLTGLPRLSFQGVTRG